MIASIGVKDRHVGQVRQVLPTAESKVRVDFRGGDVARRPDELCEDRGEVPGPAANVDGMISLV